MNVTATLYPYLRGLLEWAGAQLQSMRLKKVFLRPTPAFALARRLGAFALASGAVALIAAPSAHAYNDWRGDDTWSNGQLVSVQVNVDGDAAPLYWSPDRGDRRYFEAFAGRNYSLTLRNNTGQRVAVLLAVDGLNVVNGEISQLQSNEPMYVLGPYENATIRGWRTSLDEVRKFVFVDERRSYAERTGQANSDMGWIRVLTFREQRPWWGQVWRGDRPPTWPNGPRANFRDDGIRTHEEQPKAQADAPPAAPREMAAPQPDQLKAGAPSTREGLAYGEPTPNSNQYPGTGWGERSHDRVREIAFTPEPRPTDQLILRYEYASGLQALGIFIDRDRLHERDGQVGFARPPRR